MSRPGISDAYLNPLLLGYVAFGLRRSIYPSLLSINLAPAADPLSVPRLAEEVAILLWVHAPELYSRTLSLAQQRGAGAGRHQELYAVLRNLGKHATPQNPFVRLYFCDSGCGTKILEIVPDLTLHIEDILRTPPFSPFGHEDAKVLALAQWFKRSFMAWRDPILCQRCQGTTESAASDEPTDEERRDGAGRVELHRCMDVLCAEITRFPRYNDPFTLLRTRTGRCGEWAHLFYEVLRATGLQARYVWNSEDHVWTEYWSPAVRHWVHVDSCEAAVGKPLLYARGWGKKQAFCIAIGSEGTEDVTRAYVDDWEDCLSRRRAKRWNEETLAQSLMEGTLRLRLAMSRDDVLACEERDRLHRAWIDDESQRWREAERDDLKGRISGPADWRATRDELGAGAIQIARPDYIFARAILSSLNMDGSTVLGDASIGDGGILLTSKSDQVSAVFAKTRIRQDTSFRVELAFRLTAPPGSQGADGIALAFLSQPSLGLGGFGLGYTHEEPQLGDFAIEVDTFRSYDYAADPPVPHISVHSPPHAHHQHSIACSASGTLPPLNDGKLYRLEAIYNGKTRRLMCWLHTATEDDISLWEAVIPPPATLQSGQDADWCIGVTGSTGGLWQTQEVISLSVQEIILDDGVEMQTDDT